MIDTYPPGYDPVPRVGPDLSVKSTRYPPFPLEVRDGIEVRTFAASFPGARLNDRAVTRYAAQRLVDGIVVQRGPSRASVEDAEHDADDMAAGKHGTCRECKSPCDVGSRFDPADERPTCPACIESIRRQPGTHGG